jgi:PhoH-like ATPase
MINLDGLRPYVIDTNTALDYPQLIGKYQVVVTSHMLREVEKLETQKSFNKELLGKIIKAKKVIDDNEDTLFVDLKDYVWDINEDYDKDYVDNKILQCCIENDYGLLTKDRLLRIKAKMYNIPVIKPEKEILEDNYKGYKVVNVSETELAYFYENINKNLYELYQNQYLIIRDENDDTMDIRRWNGSTHVELKLPPKKYIDAKNDLQACALDLLNNKDIPVKFILGTYGSGKTYLNTKMAIYHVMEKGNQAKIMVIRNPIGSGEEIGWLKGDKDDKTKGFFKPFIQHLDGGEQTAEFLEQRGVLEKEIPYYMKGLDIQETFMLCDEAEDLNVTLIKLIGTRIGKNSVLTFSGDYNQAEGKYVNNNGLLYAVEGLKGNPLVGVVVLDLDVRSDASKIFADL